MLKWGKIMEYNKAIEHGFNLFVDSTFKNESIKAFLKTHERLHLMVERLAVELRKNETALIKSGTNQEDRRKFIKSLIGDFSRMFCKNAIDEIALKRDLNANEKESNEKESRSSIDL